MFKPHDIRGKYGTDITAQKFFRLGRAAALSLGKKAVTARDYREHHDELEAAFSAGFKHEGGTIISRLGPVPTPVVAFANSKLAVIFTASHNPSGYCGAKFFSGREFASEEGLRSLEEKYGSLQPTLEPKEFDGLAATDDSRGIIQGYVEDLPVIGPGVFDLSGGAVCAVKQIFANRIFDAPDPQFKLHDAEPKDQTLHVLKERTVRDNLVGYAFDGDGDRMMVADKGRIVEGHAVACFLAQSMLKKNDRVVLSIDCASEAFAWLEDHGFNAVYSKVGDVNVIRTAMQVGAKMGAERSGHYSFTPSHPYPDGIRAAALVSQHAMAGDLLELAKTFKNVTLIEPVYCTADFAKLAGIARGSRGVLKVIDLDGVKADFEDYAILIRQSNTEPKIRVNVESANTKLAKVGMQLALGWVKECALS